MCFPPFIKLFSTCEIISWKQVFLLYFNKMVLHLCAIKFCGLLSCVPKQLLFHTVNIYKFHSLLIYFFTYFFEHSSLMHHAFSIHVYLKNLLQFCFIVKVLTIEVDVFIQNSVLSLTGQSGQCDMTCSEHPSWRPLARSEGDKVIFIVSGRATSMK